MKSRIVLGGILLFLSFLILACNDKITEPSDEITAKPVVKKTAINYSEQSFINSFPDGTSLTNISEAYSYHYSEELRDKILDYMKGEVVRLGEDVSIFDSVLVLTGCKLSGEYILPTYAEKAQYENQDAWIFQITYDSGTPIYFGNCTCFVLSTTNFDTLAVIASRWTTGYYLK
jgi:hypothetical protein